MYPGISSQIPRSRGVNLAKSLKVGLWTTLEMYLQLSLTGQFFQFLPPPRDRNYGYDVPVREPLAQAFVRAKTSLLARDSRRMSRRTERSRAECFSSHRMTSANARVGSKSFADGVRRFTW